MVKKIVIALGGNAILRKGEKPTIETQIKHIGRAMRNLFPIIKNNKVVITHGNGPQAGYLLLQQNAPLDIIDAETEGQIGYLIQQELFNLFRKNRVKKDVVTVLTQVVVGKNDSAFRNKTKFVGPFYSKKEAQELWKKFSVKEDRGGGWRRVVSSPKPVRIIESDTIKRMLNDGAVVIAAGGGGIPVIEKNGILKGIEAVIDKDLASACLGNSIGADELIMITDIDRVYLNYGKKNQKGLGKVRLKDLNRYYGLGHFPAGSMGPKIKAAINFLSKGGKKVIITNVENINNEKMRTVIVRWEMKRCG